MAYQLGRKFGVRSILTIGIVASILFLTTMLDAPRALAQTQISGQVNKYVAVTEVVPCDSMVRVANRLTLKPGDRVLLMQMAGAKIITTNTAEFGTISDINGAGNAEFLEILSVVGDNVTFTTRMVHKYDADGSIQLVYVPVYDDVEIVAPLSTPKWNGTIGGVIAIEARGEVFLRSDISLDGRGFSGGNVSVNIDACDTWDYVLNWNFGGGGGKGEGAATYRLNYSIGGRGPLASGGGGGNGTNAGGAGGGNGGMGGNGGRAVETCPNGINDVGGIGGASMASYVGEQKFYLGGGGGGGHQNDLVGTPGTPGGGLIIIRASVLHGNGHTITSSGTNVPIPPPPIRGANEPGRDGAGGGGAGGTIVLDVDSLSSPLTVVARGGNGGDILHPYNGHGPGGGGGGGVIVTKKPLAGLTTNVAGGMNGVHTNDRNLNYLEARGATRGEQGIVQTGLVWRKPLSVKLTSTGGGPICEGQTMATLEAREGFASYVWSDGQTGRVVQVGVAGQYSLIAIDSSGCPHTTTPLEVWYNPTQVYIPNSVDFGSVAFETTERRTITIRNIDDEPIVIARIANSANFRVVEPGVWPVRINPNASRDIVIEFYAGFDQEYNEELEVFISSPCALQQTIEVRAVVSPIWTYFSIPDTMAKIGDTMFAVPVYLTVAPDTIKLDSSHLLVNLTMDSRLFAPRYVTRGRIVRNTIDLINNTRELTIEIERANFRSSDNVVTRVVGSVLMANVVRTPIEFLGVEWKRVWQKPIDDFEEGSLLVDPVCFQQARFIRLFDAITMSIQPNPASNSFVVNTNFTAPGLYDIQVVNTNGKVIYKQSIHHADGENTDRQLTIDSSQWPNGTYIVRYSTPFAVFTERVVISR